MSKRSLDRSSENKEHTYKIWPEEKYILVRFIRLWAPRMGRAICMAIHCGLSYVLLRCSCLHSRSYSWRVIHVVRDQRMYLYWKSKVANPLSVKARGVRLLELACPSTIGNPRCTEKLGISFVGTNLRKRTFALVQLIPGFVDAPEKEFADA